MDPPPRIEHIEPPFGYTPFCLFVHVRSVLSWKHADVKQLLLDLGRGVLNIRKRVRVRIIPSKPYRVGPALGRLLGCLFA